MGDPSVPQELTSDLKGTSMAICIESFHNREGYFQDDRNFWTFFAFPLWMENDVILTQNYDIIVTLVGAFGLPPPP